MYDKKNQMKSYSVIDPNRR